MGEAPLHIHHVAKHLPCPDANTPRPHGFTPAIVPEAPSQRVHRCDWAALVGEPRP